MKKLRDAMKVGIVATVGLGTPVVTATDAVAQSASNVIDCDTTGHRRADGGVNTTGPSRGAVFRDLNGDGLNTRVFGLDGRPCSTPEGLPMQEGSSDKPNYFRGIGEQPGKPSRPAPAPTPTPDPVVPEPEPEPEPEDDDGRGDDGGIIA